MTPEILNLLFPDRLPSIKEIEKLYPKRRLPEGAIVSRLAPSPTGYLHIGNFYQGFLAERLAHTHGGVFFLRVEDTDQARKVEGAVEVVLNALSHYGINPDEGPQISGKEVGKYGPYTQSKRRDIYQAYAKEWVKKGLAYPCFCAASDIEMMRKIQEKQGLRPGYYGRYAKCRELTDQEILDNLKAGKPFVIRMRSPGNYENRIVVDDLLKGKLSMPEYDMDIVILKGDGLPTYHFAHLIDDHLMGTTNVVRGEEWLSSLPLHLQMFQMMGWQPPKYAHHALLQKMDERGKRRKISKRLDPEANIEYFAQNGYPQDAVLEYLLNLMNASFEEWRKANPTTPVLDFPLNFNKISNTAGALFDFVKLHSICREVIARMTAEEVYKYTLEWAQKFNPAFAKKMESKSEMLKAILNIERGIGNKSRKDLTKWSDVEKESEYFFNAPETIDCTLWAPLIESDVQKIAKDYAAIYNDQDDKETWFNKVKQVASQNGFAANMKDYKAHPSDYKGSVADVAKVLRILITGRVQSPDLYQIMAILGKKEVLNRLGKVQ